MHVVPQAIARGRALEQVTEAGPAHIVDGHIKPVHRRLADDLLAWPEHLDQLVRGECMTGLSDPDDVWPDVVNGRDNCYKFSSPD